MKKLFIILLSCFLLLSCNQSKEPRVATEKNKQIIAMFKSKYPEDDFYFIQGLHYEKDINTNIRYRGILYSDRLERLGYPFGMELALEENDDGWVYLNDYKATFLKIEVDRTIEEKMKEIFGEKSILDNNFWVSSEGYKISLSKRGRKLSLEEKSGAYYTVVNVFVDRLEDMDKEKMKRKTYDFARFLYDEINLATFLQVYIRDNTFFEDYDLVRYQVYPPFRESEDIQRILEKIENMEEITEGEKIALVNVFYKGIGFSKRFTSIKISFSREELKSYKEQKFFGNLLREDYIDEGK